MFTNLRKRDEGFTLIELLVVILIIGILAAIALPTFLGQQKKGQDASAKSDARNLVTQVESCFADTQTYASCDDADLGSTGLTLGSAAGQVEVTPASATSFAVIAHSLSGNTFRISRASSGAGYARACTTAADGGCPSSGVW